MAEPRSPRILAVAALVALAALVMGAPARAERADREKPLQVESDRLVYDDAKQVGTFTGNVVATKGTILIRGDRLVLRQDAAGNQHSFVYGNPASFRQKREGLNEFIEGYGGEIDYDSSSETAHIRQNAVLRKLEKERVTEEMFGQLIVYEGKTDSYTVDGSPTRTPSSANPSGRVRVVIQPKPAEPAAKPDAAPKAGAPGTPPAATQTTTPAAPALKPADSLSLPKTGERR